MDALWKQKAQIRFYSSLHGRLLRKSVHQKYHKGSTTAYTIRRNCLHNTPPQDILFPHTIKFLTLIAFSKFQE